MWLLLLLIVLRNRRPYLLVGSTIQPYRSVPVAVKFAITVSVNVSFLAINPTRTDKFDFAQGI
jgi:hypothetical protein